MEDLSYMFGYMMGAVIGLVVIVAIVIFIIKLIRPKKDDSIYKGQTYNSYNPTYNGQTYNPYDSTYNGQRYNPYDSTYNGQTYNPYNPAYEDYNYNPAYNDSNYNSVNGEEADSKAKLALIFGILSILMFCCCSFLGIPLGIAAIVLAVLSKKDNGGSMPGMAIAGLFLGILTCVITIVYSISLLLAEFGFI